MINLNFDTVYGLRFAVCGLRFAVCGLRTDAASEKDKGNVDKWEV